MRFPFETGEYSVAPGLRRLTGAAISVQDLERYRREKRAAAAKRTVCLEHELGEAARAAALERLLELLRGDHPEVYGGALPESLEELPFLMAEDVAVVRVEGDREWLAFGHICLPSSWRLEEKIGRSFLEVHRPVPGFVEKGSGALVRSLVEKGPYERYAWGLTNADVLDQEAGVHAEVAPEPLWVRVERQTMHPLGACGGWLFLIHPVNTRVEELSGGQREALARAVESMTEEQAAYKGLAGTRGAVVARLRRG